MCCRYGYETGTEIDVERIADLVLPGAKKIPKGDVHPSEPAVILKAGPEKEEVYADTMQWGFLSFDRKLLINARSESALEKKSFSDSILHRRCIIPAAHFYEWDKNKIKNTFTPLQGASLYMAGFYNLFDNENRFIILTTAANGSMAPVHDRMPLLLPEEKVREWIWRDDFVQDYLRVRPAELGRTSEFEQLSFFDYF